MACFYFTFSFYLHFHLLFTRHEYILKNIIPLYSLSLTGLCTLSTHKFPTPTKHNVHKFSPELNCRVLYQLLLFPYHYDFGTIPLWYQDAPKLLFIYAFCRALLKSTVSNIVRMPPRKQRSPTLNCLSPQGWLNKSTQ